MSECIQTDWDSEASRCNSECDDLTIDYTEDYDFEEDDF